MYFIVVFSLIRSPSSPHPSPPYCAPACTSMYQWYLHPSLHTATHHIHMLLVCASLFPVVLFALFHRAHCSFPLLCSSALLLVCNSAICTSALLLLLFSLCFPPDSPSLPLAPSLGLSVCHCSHLPSTRAQNSRLSHHTALRSISTSCPPTSALRPRPYICIFYQPPRVLCSTPSRPRPRHPSLVP